jgi:maltose alpha-D-glucosyltransferase/alpha-amylase
MIGAYLESARLLGRRTAEVHRALASGTEEAFAPEAFSQLYQRSLYQSMRTQTRRALQLLARRLADLPGDVRHEAERVAGAEDQILARFRKVTDQRITAMRIRCHGDYHLGQVLFTGKDFVLIDFEGEPVRPVTERRIKRSPLQDVAGMIRSLHYASHAAQRGQAPGATVASGARPRQELARWMHVWYSWSAAAFLGSYLDAAGEGRLLPSGREQLETLLNAYLLDKAIYELAYELNNRPDWVKIPLEGILELLDAA